MLSMSRRTKSNSSRMGGYSSTLNRTSEEKNSPYVNDLYERLNTSYGAPRQRAAKEYYDYEDDDFDAYYAPRVTHKPKSSQRKTYTNYRPADEQKAVIPVKEKAVNWKKALFVALFAAVLAIIVTVIVLADAPVVAPGSVADAESEIHLPLLPSDFESLNTVNNNGESTKVPVIGGNETTKAENTNWFDSFCNWLEGVVGG